MNMKVQTLAILLSAKHSPLGVNASPKTCYTSRIKNRIMLSLIAIGMAAAAKPVDCSFPAWEGNPIAWTCDAKAGSVRARGLDDLIVVKANTSFKVAYAPFAGVICAADTPGAGASNLHSLKWTKLPHGLYPFDLPAGYELAPARIWRQSRLRRQVK